MQAKAMSTPDRQHDDGDKRAADVQQEDDADQGDDDAFLDQRALRASRSPPSMSSERS